MAINKTILVVEDESAIADPLIQKLKTKGFRVQRAKDGEEGLALAISLRPDMILLDISMPKMNGVEMLKNLRQHEEGKTVKVMMMTNVNDPTTAGATAGLGVFDYIVKADWKLDDIVAAVQKQVGA